MNGGARPGAAIAALVLATIAQADDAARRGFDPDPFRPALGLDRDVAVETAAGALRGSAEVGVLFDYAEGLLSLRMGSGTRTPLLESRLSLHVLGAYSFGPFEVGVDLPFALDQKANLSPLIGVNGALVDPIAGSALGDLRLVAKAPLLTQARAPVGLAAVLDLRAPTGDPKAFTSDGWMAIPSAVVTRSLGPVRLDGQLGYAFRRPGQYLQLVAHDGLTYGAAASVELPPWWKVRGWRAIAELTGGWPRGNDAATDRYRAPLSARGAVRARLPLGLVMELGGGAGLGAAGYGREAWRVFLGLSWERLRQDRDGDGVPDDEDWCPDLPGLPEIHGCPDEDTDGDGVPNRIDLCPLEKGPPETDGCPDTDLDGIPDREDKCPNEPGPPQNDGCPVREDVPIVEIETERLELRDAIQFDTGKDTLKPGSFRVLDVVVRLLQEHPDIRRIRVEGHTDNVGSATYNRDLSQRRAQTVVSYLASKGVVRERLVPQGYGFERPVASNATAGGRAKNRRVEFTILQGEEAEAPRK